MDSLLPVIVGGVIGVAGGVIGPILMHWLQAKDDKRKRLAEKFEELVSAVYEHDRWLDTIRDHRIFREEAPIAISPLRKVQTISTVYFPTFEPTISRLEDGARQYEMWMLATAQRKLENPSASVMEGHSEAYRAYSVQRDILLSELRGYARQHFNPD